MDFLGLSSQGRLIEKNLKERWGAILAHGQYVMGPEVEELEGELARFLGGRQAITCANGTDALIVGLQALGVGPGDEVITTAFSFFATAEAIVRLGARPVFVDIDRRTYLMDTSLVARGMTKKTKAIVPVSLYGQCVDWGPLERELGVPVLEDGAQSFGAQVGEKKSCALTTMATTSFFPTKPLGCYGDGGAIFTNDESLAGQLRKIRNHGQHERYLHTCIGLNSRLDSLQAAVLLEKLGLFEQELAQRAQVAKRYDELLGHQVPRPVARPGSIYAQYTIEVENRPKVVKQMAKDGIPVSVHYPRPLGQQPALEEWGRDEEVPMALEACQKVLSLPMHPYLRPEDQQLIVGSLLRAIS